MSNQEHPEQHRQETVRRNRRRSRLYTINTFLFLGFVLLFIGSAVGISFQLYQDWRDAETFAGLNELLTEPSENGDTDTEPSEMLFETEPTDQIPVQEPDQEPQILAKYIKIYEMNPDVFGWISVEGTGLSYPVMHTPQEEERYLRKGFNGEYSRSGVPFVDADCAAGCGNYIVYGHNMTNGTMFAPLISYQNEGFWREHPIISFDTLYEEGAYEVIAAFYSRVFYKYEKDVFRYYEYDDLTDPNVFSEYVEQVRNLAIYDTGVEAEPGDQLITLITCSYGFDTERFVVVARKQA